MDLVGGERWAALLLRRVSPRLTVLLVLVLLCNGAASSLSLASSSFDHGFTATSFVIIDPQNPKNPILAETVTGFSVNFTIIRDTIAQIERDWGVRVW